jgi:hypothetical protein
MENPESTHPVKPARFPTVRRLRRALFSRKMLYAILALITLVALFYAEENFRGARAWENYRKDAEARGIKLDFAAHIPPPIPDAENGANTPFIQDWFPKGSVDQSGQWPLTFSDASELLGVKNRSTGAGAQDDRYLPDFTGWQEAFANLRETGNKKTARKVKRTSHDTTLDPKEQVDAARRVLEELKIYEPVLTELRVASRHEKVRYPVTYNREQPFGNLIPHLSKIKGILQVLKLRASAELAAGQTDAAFADVKLMFWLCDSMEHEPFLVSHLVRIAGRQIVTQPVWEGLARHQWSDAQLQELQGRFARTDFAGALDRTLSGERAGAITMIDGLRNKKTRGPTLDMLFDPQGLPDDEQPRRAWRNLAVWLVPSGWFQMEKVSYGRMMELNMGGWDSREKLFHPRAVEENGRQIEKRLQYSWVHPVWNHYMFARIFLPALGRSAGRSARAQSTATQAALACALERFYLAEGKYPAALTELVPKYLAKVPHEVVSSEPMRYRAEHGGYVLWSAGWDGKDDGGIFLRAAKDGKPETGDWVWRSAP